MSDETKTNSRDEIHRAWTQEDEGELEAALSRLPGQMDPPAELWSRIRAQIQAKPEARPESTPEAEPSRGVAWHGISRMGVAAAVVLGTVWWGAANAPEPGGASDPVVAGQGPAPSFDRDTETRFPTRNLLPHEPDYRVAMAGLSETYQNRRDQLSDDVVALFDGQLEQIDHAIERSRGALADEPRDPDLQRMLDHAYRHKLELLKQAAQATRRPR